jgi:hypothetical protein
VSVTYPLFVFEKDDKSIRLIENESRILYHLEAIDIENEEYVFWDSSGSGVLVTVTPTRIFKQGSLIKWPHAKRIAGPRCFQSVRDEPWTS